MCLGNICRSPLAAAVLAQHGGAAVEVRSAGLAAKWVGRPADPPMIAVARAHGYDLTTHRACALSAALLQWADVILAMDHTVLTALRDRADEHTRPKLSLYLGDRDVPDPFGHPAEAFEKCVALIESGADHHVQPLGAAGRSATEHTR
ncbi:low molecular weight protein-tyrosine-phosphatase [Nocardia iowensis]|uniref:low molecular weight protein-tyrosine-phosphatase n=1 Tax=Nocardia iowensis TaxID=204891 RepID=UPI003C2C1B94